MRILFSAIGLSDPVCSGHDAGWLHCCRHIHPDKTVVYLTAETWKREQERHMYSRSLELLNRHTGDNTVFASEDRPDLTDPHDFDRFYDDFERVLMRLHQENPEAQIYLNISSGTPAIKSTMILMYHLLPFPTTLLQVDGPHSKMGSGQGERDTVPDDYDPDAGWMTDLDNRADYRDRCHVHQSIQQSLRLQHMQLRTLIEKNEHYAARLLARTMGDYCPASLYHGLSGAQQRMQLDIKSAVNELAQAGWEEAGVLQKNKDKPLYLAAEMALTMQCDLNRQDIAGCVRKLTPVLFALLCHHLENNCHVMISRITDRDHRKLIEGKLKAAYPSLYSAVQYDLFQYGNPMFGSHSIIALLEASHPVKDSALEALKELRNVEENVRNEIAHTCRMLTEAAFRKETGKSTAEMMALIHDCFERVQPGIYKTDFWKSYDRMNHYLMSLLFQQPDEQ